MKNNNLNLFINPTKKRVLYFFILWLAEGSFIIVEYY